MVFGKKGELSGGQKNVDDPGKGWKIVLKRNSLSRADPSDLAQASSL
jgi:hypothetical protein